MDELVFIQLSIRTKERLYAKTYQRLRNACAGEWSQLIEMNKSTVLEILEQGGMAELKWLRLTAQISRIIEAFGSATLLPLRRMTTEAAEEFLTSLPGVGPKTARCVLLYSLDRAVFPVDSHCLRVMARLGFLPERVDRKAAHDVLQDLVPVDLRHSLHVNLVHHGRSLCIGRNPRCEPCPVLDLCPTGDSAVNAQ
ncbi:MAG: endonuclease III [Gemmatimonadota bacterium]